MRKPAEIGSLCRGANGCSRAPSTSGGVHTRRYSLSVGVWICVGVLIAAGFALPGCGGQQPSTPQPTPETKPAELTVPEEVQTAADKLLGKETTVLLFGDLAKNGKQELLAANVVPKSTKNNLPGTIITRAVVAENENGHWAEILRCDEHLKNAKGYLPGTPLSGITGWRLAYEQDAEKGMALYFTPLKGTAETHQLPIGVRWNPEAKRYQSLDRSYEHFLQEAPSLQNARSSLR
jgi:hypothetical protein